MKKLIAFALTMIMVTGIYVCSDENVILAATEETNGALHGDTTPATVRATGVPTDEERKLLGRYYTIAVQLQQQNISREQMREYYLELQGMEAVDPWIGTEYASGTYLRKKAYTRERADGDASLILDRQTLLNLFVVLEDVPVYINCETTNLLGTVSRDTAERKTDANMWEYYRDGKIASQKENGNRHHITLVNSETFPQLSGNKNQYQYDSQGRLQCVRYLNRNGEEVLLHSYVYGETGKLVREVLKGENGESTVLHQYDENGRLLQSFLEVSDTENRSIDYIYNEKGQLIREEMTVYGVFHRMQSRIEKKQIREYTYDASGRCIDSAYIHQVWGATCRNEENYVFTESVDLYTYTYDTQGRIVSETVIPGDTIYCHGDHIGKIAHKAEQTRIVYTYIYGDYCYFFNSANFPGGWEEFV